MANIELLLKGYQFTALLNEPIMLTTEDIFPMGIIYQLVNK